MGSGAVVRRAIIDKNVKIPAGATIGVDPDLDLARGFLITESGLTVLSKGQIVPAPDEAERALSLAAAARNSRSPGLGRWQRQDCEGNRGSGRENQVTAIGSAASVRRG